MIAWVLAAPLCAQGSRPQDPRHLHPGDTGDDNTPTPARILEDLDSRNYQTKRRAVLAARKVKAPAILDKLLQLAVHARHPNIKGYACETLGHYRDPRIFPVLAEAATQGRISTRMGALPGLGLLGDRRSYQLLVKAVADHRSNWRHAAVGLRHLGDKRGAGPLADIFRRHLHDHAVFGAVAEAILALDPDRAVELFFAAIQDEKTYRHHRLDRLLGRVRTKTVRERAQKLLAHEDIRVRSTGLRILGHSGDVGTVAVLLKVMDGDEALRQEAIRAIGELGHELAVPQVARYLSADSADQRAVAAEALGKIGHSTAVRSLVLVLRKEEETIPKLRMIEALGRIRDNRAVAELGRHLDDASMKRQSMLTSSIASFPYNTSVNWVAWWALCCTRDGKEPMPLLMMFSFPTARGPEATVKKSAIEATNKWWQEHRDKPGFSLQK